MIKAFLVTYNICSYDHFLQENKLNRREYPRLTETNWLGVHGADLIVIELPHPDTKENQKLIDMIPHIREYFLATKEK